MKTTKLTNVAAPATPVRPLPLALALAFVSMTASAGVVIDQQPLNTQKPIPPNIMFIMDDSGSMGWEHMPGTAAAWSGNSPSGLPKTVNINDMRLRAANINAMWYNPLVNYTPWLKYDGSSYPNANYDGGNVAADPSGKSGNGTLNFKTTFTAWKTLGTGSSGVGNTTAMSTSTGMVSSDDQWRYSGFYHRTGSSETNVTHYKRYDFIYGCASGSSCGAASKKWRAREVSLKTNGTDDSAAELSEFDWTPYGGSKRSVTQEMQNYANWFSYYRLRATMAKAASSRVFSQLDEHHRIGFHSIHNRTASRFPIPVNSNNGLFESDNKSKWFDALFAANSNDGTPLREALGRIGEYFSGKSITANSPDPYGPEAGSAQLSCRQNFAILTTDGYWNGNEAGNAAARADNDSLNGGVITGIGGVTYQYIADHPFKDGRSNTLADVAMYYWKNDLRDLKNDVPTTPSNPAFWQHMRTFGVSIGEKGTLNPQTDLPALSTGTKSWPAPGNDKQENIDDLWHAAINSRGEFLVASNPDEFATALTDALTKISSETRSATSGASSTSQLNAGTMAFFTEYSSGSWNGEIKAYELDPTTASFKAGSGWSASTKLPPWASRNINFNDGSTQKAFTYPNLNASQQSAMSSADHVDYLRGDRSKEKTLANPAGIFRERTSALADFVNSQLVHVGAPNANIYKGASFSGANNYKAFATASRRAQVYVGGNGGMLHAIDATTGVEKYAFVPSSVINADLKSLTDPNYVHRYFVDGELTVASAYVSGGWKSILVGSLGRGGKGLFALDVTDPDAIKFLWEKTATEIPALGNSLGKPVIAQVANGNWQVLVGNGPNGNGDLAQLIMIDVATGAATTVSTGVAGNNGLSAIRAWDSNGDGFTDSAYAGDLNGNVWRFTGLGSSPSANLLFSARDGGGNAQPIMAAPVTAINPDTKDLWVFVGTGRYLNEADAKSMAVQSWYGLIDAGTSVARGNLVERKITSSGEIEGRAVRVLETGSAADLAGKSGWHIDFNTWGGERMILPNTFYGNLLVAATLTPEVVDLCNPTGRGMLWGINPFTGARMSRPIFDVNGDGLFDDTLGGDPPSVIAIEPIFGGSITVVGGTDETGLFLTADGKPQRFRDLNLGAGLTSWREILGN